MRRVNVNNVFVFVKGNLKLSNDKNMSVILFDVKVYLHFLFFRNV